MTTSEQADPSIPTDTEALELIVQGVVQGVGFRPFVHRIASAERLSGWVRNAADGVHIAIFGPSRGIFRFKSRLHAEAPPLARIDRVIERVTRSAPPGKFTIVDSTLGDVCTAVAPDAALCGTCRAELFDPADRRYQYPFLNCTHCGPRFSIVQALPYDRPNTSMSRFEMCPACRAEYEDVRDRRFHAQPVACPACGPSLWLERPGADRRVAVSIDAVREAQNGLLAGETFAIKGIGGFHLACSALNDGAIVRLRDRKRRPSKPFAVMVRDIDVARRYCVLGPDDEHLLESPAAPIVLLATRPEAGLPESLAPGLDRLGVMLPYSPLHALLMVPFEFPLVMTSGNAGQDPQVIANEEARRELSSFVDGFLMHDREIVNRIDDSLVQRTDLGFQVLRRARGYAPRSVPLPPGFPSDHAQVLAFGGDIKNTFALAKGGNVVMSQHIGDLTSLKSAGDLAKNIRLYRDMYDLEPQVIAADPHPGYRSSRLARELAETNHLSLIEVPHHHAHAASCMAEHGLPLDHPPVLALVQDGLGMSGSGELWGAELLYCDYRMAERRATLKPAALLGGDQAAREPWRNLVARLADAFPAISDWPRVLRERLASRPVATLLAACRAGVNAPLCSSAGRLFDAVAAAAGLCCDRQDYEGEAAMRLQSAAERWIFAHRRPSGYCFGVARRADGSLEIDPAAIWPSLADDLARGASPGEIAAKFHSGWASVWCQTLLQSAPAPDKPEIVLSGGVFQNRLLGSMICSELAAAGCSVLEHREIPANDGGLGLGQIAIALARRIAGKE